MKHMQQYSHTSNCVYDLKYHMVLVTKKRAPVLSLSILDDMRNIISERCRVRIGEMIEFGGEVDHIHILFSLPPAESISLFANAVKTSTSRALRRDYPHLRRMGGALWSPSYFVCSCGGASLETIKEYVRSQEQPSV